MVARERFWRREKGVWQEVALFPYDSGFGLDGRHYISVRFSYEHGFHILRTFLFPLGVSVCLLGTVRCSFLGVQVSSSEKESFLDCKEEAVLDKRIRTYRQLEHV